MKKAEPTPNRRIVRTIQDVKALAQLARDMMLDSLEVDGVRMTISLHTPPSPVNSNKSPVTRGRDLHSGDRSLEAVNGGLPADEAEAEDDLLFWSSDEVGLSPEDEAGP